MFFPITPQTPYGNYTPPLPPKAILYIWCQKGIYFRGVGVREVESGKVSETRHPWRRAG